VVWCCNDYLCIGHHPKVVDAMCQAARAVGRRRRAQYLWHQSSHRRPRRRAADRKEAALVFTSGYFCNLTGIATIAKLVPNCLILLDPLNHNSKIEGGGPGRGLAGAGPAAPRDAHAPSSSKPRHGGLTGRDRALSRQDRRPAEQSRHAGRRGLSVCAPLSSRIPSDRRVIEVSWFAWFFFLNGLILTTRPARKRKDYAAI
jgi:hypothetical protein